MKRMHLPAWQQVLLTVLENIPGAQNGSDAWDKMNEAEKAAVMDFLAAHCGNEAQARLDETCARIKHPRWWNWVWAIPALVVFVAAFVFLMLWLEEKLAVDVSDYLWLVLCPLNMLSAWQGNPMGKAQEIWKKRVENREGATHALNDMYRTYTLPRAQRMNKGLFICWLVMWFVWIGLILFKNLG